MSGPHLSAAAVRVRPAYQRQGHSAPRPDWLPWVAVSERAGRLKSRPDSAVPRRCPNAPPRLARSDRPSFPTAPLSELTPLRLAVPIAAVSEAVDAAVYTVRAPVSAVAPPHLSRLRLR
jgi:hypothetical protein